MYVSIEKSLQKYFGKRGEQVVADNLTCVRRGYEEVEVITAADIDAMEVSA
jgi:Pyruvate/2-oxoacid:ferredoxin oxidoreductase gamma subunit